MKILMLETGLVTKANDPATDWRACFSLWGSGTTKEGSHCPKQSFRKQFGCNSELEQHTTE